MVETCCAEVDVWHGIKWAKLGDAWLCQCIVPPPSLAILWYPGGIRPPNVSELSKAQQDSTKYTRKKHTCQKNVRIRLIVSDSTNDSPQYRNVHADRGLHVLRNLQTDVCGRTRSQGGGYGLGRREAEWHNRSAARAEKYGLATAPQWRPIRRLGSILKVRGDKSSTSI